MASKHDMPNRSHRRKGTENTLARITYSVVSELAGISPTSAKRYAWRKRYDQHDLASILRFCAEMRSRSGLPPLGT